MATVLGDLGLALEGAGRFADAESAQTRAMEIRRKAYGPEHPDIATGLNNIGVLRYRAGRPADAVPMFRAAIAMWRQSLGETHPSVLAGLNNLGAALGEAGDLAAAEPVLREALRLRTQVLGERHADVASSHNNLAGLLRRRPNWSSDRALIVLGHRERIIGPDHRISRESRARLRRAARECRHDPPRAVILTGYTRTGGLSEAEQMEEEWSVPGVPAVLEDAGRDTAENASRSLPIIRAIGEISRVTVVTSAWHLRAPYFFAPYRVFGMRLSFRFSARGNWPRMLWHELRQLPAARRERRRAMAETRLPPEVALPSPDGPSQVGETA